MSNAKVIEDELWDHYSGLPNPMWYQHNTELDEEEETINEDKSSHINNKSKP